MTAFEHLKDPAILKSGSLVLDCRLPVPGGAHIMGILNVTPDSFFDGGRYMHMDAALAHVKDMIEAGAVLIDIGGASSRPRGSVYGFGAAVVTPEEELARILPVVRRVVEEWPEVWVSVDTFHPDVAGAVLKAGAHIINDITGLRVHPELAEVVASADAPLILMHSLGTPGDMPHARQSEDILRDVRLSLNLSVRIAREAGIRQLVLDPGFGFGKTPDDNLALIQCLDRLSDDGLPLMVGISRKSSIGISLSDSDQPVPVDRRLYGSLGLTALAVMRGASIVRTHDVSATKDCLQVLGAAMQACGRRDE